jgi:hypothetical protein
MKMYFNSLILVSPGKTRKILFHRYVFSLRPHVGILLLMTAADGQTNK